MRFKPLSSKLSNSLHILIDFNISLSYSLTGLFLIKQEGFNREYIEWIIIGIVAFSFAFVMSINIYNILIAVLHYLRKLKKAKITANKSNEEPKDTESNILPIFGEICTTNYIEDQSPSSPGLFSGVDIKLTIRIDECDRNSISES